jgi:hypothetical protein
MFQHQAQDGVLDDIGEVSGVIGVAVIHGRNMHDGHYRSNNFQGNRVNPDCPALFIALSRRAGASAPLAPARTLARASQCANALKINRK